MADKVEVVVIGAGLAGLSAACTLAAAGIETFVVERGDFPGSKNVTGGRLYMNPVRPFFPADFWQDAPFERAVVKEKLSLLSETAGATLEFSSDQFRREPYASYTLLRAKFDQWLADKARDQGALIVPKNQVDDLIFEGGRVAGVKSTEAEILADVVLVADGAMSFMAEKAGLRKERRPRDYALGVKEVIELPAKTIQDRFGLKENEGAAQLFFGTVTQGMTGGGFLYTNRESISLGMVVGIKAMMDHQPPVEAPELMEIIKTRPEVAPLVEGGTTVEYSAHVIPEGGLNAVPKLVGDGILVAGDAAGLALNMGMTVRGMDFALASGVLAARAIVEAKARNDYSEASLSAYRRSLESCFVLKDLETFRAMPDIIENPRMFSRHPGAIAQILEKMFWIGDQPKAKLSSTAIRAALQGFGNLDAVKDALGLLKV